MAVQLTESAIGRAVKEAASAKKRRELADSKFPGLRLRVTPPSQKTPAGMTMWVLCCRDREQRMRRFELGRFPDIGISEARDRARALHVDVRQKGADPVAERRRDRAIGQDAKAGIGTLKALLDLYEKRAGAKLRTWEQSRARIERVFKSHLDRPLAKMKASDLQLTADSRSSANSASGAVRCLRPVLKWGAQRKFFPLELSHIVPPAAVVRRDRVLSRDELSRLLPILTVTDTAYAACMRFLLLTLARRGEAEGARWRDIDMEEKTWTIPADQAKNGQAHVVPLSTQALVLLHKRLPRGENGVCIRPDPGALVFGSAAGSKLTNWDRAAKAIMEASQTVKWHRHDLRRTGATMLGEAGELPDIVEAALNHVAIRSPLAATYNRSRYRPQVAQALQRLADELDDIESPADKPTILGVKNEPKEI